MARALEQSVETLLEAERDENRRHMDLVSLRLCDLDQDEHGRRVDQRTRSRARITPCSREVLLSKFMQRLSQTR